MNPGGVFRAALKLRAVREQPHEDFLRGIVGVLLVSQQAETDAPHALPEAFHERDKCHAVRTLAGSFGRQLLVGAFDYFQTSDPRNKHGTLAGNLRVSLPQDSLPEGAGPSPNFGELGKIGHCRKMPDFRPFRSFPEKTEQIWACWVKSRIFWGEGNWPQRFRLFRGLSDFNRSSGTCVYSDMMKRAPGNRRRLRYSLRAILLLTLGTGIGFAWVHRAQDQHAAVEQMRRSNPAAAVLYDFEVGPAGGLTQPARPPGPEWLRRRLGVDYLANIAGVDMFYPTDADVAVLTRFPNLRRVHLERSVDLTDAGMASLAKLASLKLLILGEADQVTDAGLQKLAALKNLVELRLDRSRRMTPKGIEKLRAGLPNCRITVRENPDQDPLALLGTATSR